MTIPLEYCLTLNIILMKNLNVHYTRFEKPQSTAFIVLEGPLSEMNAIQFKKDLIRFLEQGNKNCVLDIKAVNDMDLCGLNAIAMAHKALSQKGRKLTIRTTTDNPIVSLLQVTKFNRILNIQLVA